jgi:hypothetical protein
VSFHEPKKSGLTWLKTKSSPNNIYSRSSPTGPGIGAKSPDTCSRECEFEKSITFRGGEAESERVRECERAGRGAGEGDLRSKEQKRKSVRGGGEGRQIQKR